ncbi:MAG: NAD(P)H-dependent oxidoreductase [Tepidisphaeraceae bacterium]|jgi:NAD(P)H-dependent FMN reductase
MDMAPILIVCGTNRPGSNARKISQIVLGHYRAAKIPAELLSLEELTPEIFDPASYATKPPAMVKLQQRVLAAPGLHIICPEYNGSFPGVLKYFIDMLKFPESFDRKPVALVGEAHGMFGALRAVEHLQAIFSYRNAHIYPERVFIADVPEKLDDQGRLKDPALDQRLAKQAVGFAQFVGCIGGAPRPS